MGERKICRYRHRFGFNTGSFDFHPNHQYICKPCKIHFSGDFRWWRGTFTALAVLGSTNFGWRCGRFNLQIPSSEKRCRSRSLISFHKKINSSKFFRGIFIWAYPVPMQMPAARVALSAASPRSDAFPNRFPSLPKELWAFRCNRLRGNQETNRLHPRISE